MTPGNQLSLLAMVVREFLSPPRLERQPEPSATMDDLTSVEAFHRQGDENGPLLPVYHFNALALSCLLPAGGTLVDLGSGSGQFLGYLACRRPDLTIIGLDLSDTMVSIGRKALEKRGLAARVTVQTGDMTEFAHLLPSKVNAVSCIFALHHLPTHALLTKCLEQIAEVRRQTGCCVWLFDHARPNHVKTPEVFPEIFTGDSAAAFRLDSRNSLIASWRFDELLGAVDRAFREPAHHLQSRLMRLYQTHWLGESCENRGPWQASPMPERAAADFKALSGLFPGIALDVVT